MKKINCPNLAKNLIILLILSLVFVVLFSGSIYALSSDNINLQGKIVRNDTGHEGMNVIPGSPACVISGAGNDTCDFRVSYYTALTGGTLLLTEDFTNVEIGQFDGVFELSLGSGTVTTTLQCRDGTCNSPSEVISEYGDLYVELQFAPDGSTLTETFTRMPLEASPYAIFSKFAEGAHDAFKLSTSVSNESLENPSAGMIYFDTGSSQLKVYNGAEWQALSAGTSSSLWTDAGTYSYLTSTTDDLVLGGSSFNTGRFVFDMDGGSGSYFDIFNNDHSNKLFTILSSGNVGIGTATPGAKLEVGGTASTITNSTGNLTISTGGGNGNILLMPNGTGKVGIGTSSPTVALDVIGDIKASGVIRNVTVSGTTSTAAATAAKVVSIPNYTLTTGDLLSITFTNGNSVSNPTLNVNSTGAKNIRIGNTNASTTTMTISAGATLLLYYDGTYFQMMGSQRTSDSNLYDRTYWGNAITAGATIYSYKLVMQSTDGKWYPLTLESGTGTTKTVSTQPFVINSPILYYATTTTVSPNTTFSNVYSEVPTTYLNYTANQGTWTSQLPIYLKGVINSSGNFVLDNTSYISFLTQSLPTSEDGFVYILLGQMYSTTGIRLFQYHPVYEYKNGRVQQYNPSHTHNWGSILNASGVYMDYRPNNTACGLNQVLKYDSTNSKWVCADDNAGTGGDNWGSQVVITNSTLTGNGTSGSPLGIALNNANTWTGMQTFRGLTVDSATATDDRILTSITTGGSTRYDGTLTNADLTAARTWTLPNKSGTIAMTSDIPVSDNYQYWVLQANGVAGSNITSTSAVSFNGSGIVTTSRSGNTITITGTEADTLQSVTNRGATTTVSSSFTGGATIRGLIVDNATATHDRILTTVASVGTARYDGTLTNADLTAARTWTLPNNSGTIALTSDIPAGHDPVTLSGENYLSLNVQQITANKINLTSNVTGTLPIGSGGTNSTTYTSNQFLWYNGTSIVASGYNQSSFASSSHSHNWSQITNGSSIYMDYRPNNTACGLNQVLKYDSTNSRWVCADDNAGTGDNWGSQVVITNSTLTGNGTSGSPLGIALNNANTWTGMQTFRGLTVDSATATDDRILTSITTGGSTRYDGTLTNADLTAARTWTLPDVTGTIALTSNIITTFLGLTDTPSSYTGSGNYLVRVNSTATALEFVEASAFTDTDNYVDSVSFNTGDGVLTLGRTGVLPDLTTNLDGRYLQSLRWNEIQNPQGYLTLDHGMYSTLFTFNGITNSTAFSMTSSSLATGYILGLSTTSTALTEGGALDISASGAPSSSWTGNLARIEYNSGSSNVNGSALKVGLLGASAGGGTALNVTTSQTGVAALALRVNDDSTYTDPSPFVVDKNGNVGVGVVSPTSKLVVNSEGYSTIELQYNDTPVVDIFSNVSSNIFIGLDSGSVITSGYGNVALGDNALSATTIGTSNTAVGSYALDSNVAKQGSTAIGYQAMMYADSTATQGLSYNTAVGYQALVGSATASANTGMYNTAIGHQSMTANTSGSYNSTLGVNTLLNNTIGQYNVAIGYGALFTNVAKNASVAIGYEAMRYADNTVTSSTSGNIAIGYQALRGNTTASSNTGTNNVAIGYQVLYGNTTGSNSVLIGAFAGAGNTTGEYNVGIGANVLQTNVAKSKNVAIGYDAMSYANNSDSVGDTYNTALGASALRGSSTPENNTGVYNTSIGGNSGLSMTSGSNNALLGYYAGYSIITGSNNSLFGYYAGSNLTTGSNNIIIGASINADSATGSYQLNIGNAIKGDLSTGDINIVGNLGINGVPYTWPSVNGSGLLTNNGSGELSWTTSEGLGLVSGTGSAGQISYWSSTTSITGSNSFWWDSTNSRLGIGTNNPQASLSISGLVYQTGLGGSTYFGGNAGRVDDLSNNNNTGIGYRSLYSNTTGYYNTALGNSSLYSNTTGYDNTAVGVASLLSNTTGVNNIALGNSSLRSNTTGHENTALGHYSLYKNTTGHDNLALGYGSLNLNTTGSYNIAVGNYALISNTTSNENTALGNGSLNSNTTGSSNTAVGGTSLYSNITGNYNVALGYYAGRYQADGSTALTDPEYSIYIGNNAKGKDNDDNNSIVIGYNAVGLGANTVVLGNDSIVTTALKGYVGIGVTAPTYRLQLPNTANNAGKGQANAWVTYSDKSLKENIQNITGGLDKIMALRGVTFDWKGQGVASSGFIAQEVDLVIPDLVSTDINGIKALDYGRFTPYLVEAIKEQQLQIQTAYNRIEQLENINEIISITTPGWYRISKLDTNDDHSNIKINNTSIGSSQNIVLSIDSTLNNQNINIVSNLTTGGYDITKARINNENGIKYLEIYIPEVNENKISVKITESSNWITTDIVQITEEVNNVQEYALSGILFGISDKLEVEEDNVKIAGNLLSLSVNSSIGDSANRWNDIYAKGTIRIGSGTDGEGAIRFNVQTKTLEFSNNGVEWLSVGDLSSQMTISPEYAGAILFADGSDNSGVMTSDAVEESGSFKNYYEWVSNKDTPQDYDILVRITLPTDFLSWKEDAIYLDFMTENSVNTDNNSVGLSLIGNSGTDVQITEGISKIAGAWERMSIKGVDITQCNSAGGTCTLRISLTSSMEYFTRVGDITLNYNRSL